jgi:pimeloyl-ACP methyl ester carboxylesterase
VQDAHAHTVSRPSDIAGEAGRGSPDNLEGMPDDELGADGPGATAPYEFTHAGATMIVEEERSSGPHTFVLLHGLGMGRSVFIRLTARLASAGHVLAVDLPGYGEAPEPPKTLSMERAADHIAALLRARGTSPAVIVGHSMGSQIAAEVAVRHPELVRSIVLIAPTVDARARTWHQQALRLGRDLIRENPRVLFIGAREYLRSWPNFRRELKAVLAHRPEDTYPRVTVPALVMRGQKDPVAPREWCVDVARMIPNAELTEIPGHRHETMIKDAGPAAHRILGFLDRT